MAAEGPHTLQLVDGAGIFNASGLDEFVRKIRLADCGLSYAVVAIMGPQSSGKSTLLNHLFRTKFVEMDAFKGRNQTTQGVWLAKAIDIEPCTLVLDLEGTDGRERGEDDTTFEKQSSLFALAVADIVLVNMWCHDIGREHAANKPLLKTVFQVMMRLFTPRKTKLLFVIRDKTKTPIETLEPILRDDVQKIWDVVPRPEKYSETPLSEFFDLEVTWLPNYEEKEEQFVEQVGLLRERFENSIDEGKLAGDRRGVVPGSGFPLSVQEIWNVIKENKDLDLPAHKVMVATVRCEEIASGCLADLASSEAWRSLRDKAREGPVPEFGRAAGDLVQSTLGSYDAEACYFDDDVRRNKRAYLLSEMDEMMVPAYLKNLGHHRAAALARFKQELEEATGGEHGSAARFSDSVRSSTASALRSFDAAAAEATVAEMSWDGTEAREQLLRDINVHVAAIRSRKLAQIAADAEKYLVSALADPASALLDSATRDTWRDLRKLLDRELNDASKSLRAAVEGYELAGDEAAAMEAALAAAGEASIVSRAREEAHQVLYRMKERFNMFFGRDEKALPRRWMGNEDIPAITHEARAQALQVLAVLAAVRLRREPEGKPGDSIEAILLSLLDEVHGKGRIPAPPAGKDSGSSPSTSSSSGDSSKGSSASGGGASASSVLAGSQWDQVSPDDTLLTPKKCRTLWRQFKEETEYTIGQAFQTQEMSKRSNSWLPPPWAIVAIVVLGFNEFMALLRNPLLFFIIIVVGVVGRAIWTQLDVSADFQIGVVAGLLGIATKLVPTVLGILRRLVEEGQSQLNSVTHLQKPQQARTYVAKKDDTSESGGWVDGGSGGTARATGSGAIRQRHGQTVAQ